VGVTKEPNGIAENPVYNGVNLNPPDLTQSPRALKNTDFALTVNVPKYQPANQHGWTDSGGGADSGGYVGQYYVFVDTNNDGLLQRDGGKREAYRWFWLANGVPTDERFFVNTPVVDLGSLAQGAGKSNQSPSDFSPWQGPYTNMFKSFNVLNEGNVNLLDMRVAKQYGPSNSMIDWPIYPTNANP